MKAHQAHQSLRAVLVDCDCSYAQKLVTFFQSSAYVDELVYLPHSQNVVDKIIRYNSNVLLIDLDLSQLSGIGVIRALKDNDYPGEIIVLTEQLDTNNIIDSFRAGAVGYIIKGKSSPNDIQHAMLEAVNGGAPLSNGLVRRVIESFYQKRENQRSNNAPAISRREREILNLLSKGCSAKEISESLSISYHTVRTHQKNIYKKLNVSSIAEVLSKFHYKE
jgi:DNA-binding NarL/FixJ family response regulator